MTEQQAIEALAQQWDAEFPVLYPGIPAMLRNEAGPDSGTWVRVTMEHTSSRQISSGPVGSRRYERRGNVMVQVFAPVDQGDHALAGYCDGIRSFLEGTELTVSGADGALNVHSGRTQEMTEDGTWCGKVIVLPFTYYETR